MTDPPATDPPVTDPPATDPPATDPPATDPPTTEGSAIDQPANAGAAGAGAAACASPPTGLTETTLEAGGAVHDVRFYVPTSHNGTDLLPVVLNWHGLGSNGPEQAIFSGYETLAEAEGFITVHATGVPAPDSDRNSWDLIADQNPGRDDLAFADALLDETLATYCGDPDRVFSTGMSNGGFFTARLVCERADRLAGAVSVAGTYHAPDCEPSEAVPYRAYHGTADLVVSFDGSGSTLLPDDPDPLLEEFFAQVMPDEFAEFADSASCSPDPEVSQIGDDVTRYDYVGCADDAPLSFFEIEGGAHTWPNTPILDVIGDRFGYTTVTVDATVDSWEFFSSL